MGAIYEQFEVELAALRRREAGRPRREMVHLLLLALEREEIVSVGYREAMIARRLAGDADRPAAPRADPPRPGLGLEGRGDARHLPPRRDPPPGQPVAEGQGVPPPGGRGRRRLVQLRAAARPLAPGPLGPTPGHADRRDGGASPGRSPATSASTCATAPSATSACSTSTPSRPPGSAASACSSWPPRCPSSPRRWSTTSGASATTRTGTPGSSPSWPTRSTRRTGSRRG